MVSVEEWNSNGFLGPIDLQLSSAEISAIANDYETWKADSDSARFKSHLTLPAINQYLVRNKRLVTIVQELLMTENILCWSTDWNIKTAGQQGVYLPHQDSTYAGLDPATKVLTAWVAISESVSEDNGCLSFWSGSHKSGQQKHTIATENANKNLLALNQRCDPPNDQSPTTIPLRAGQATLHSFYTVHASGVNCSGHDRIGFAIRYMAASVKQTKSVRECVTLISGQMDHDEFDVEPILPSEPSEEELAIGRLAQAESLRRENANYFSAE